MAECYTALSPGDPGNGHMPDQAQPHLDHPQEVGPVAAPEYSSAQVGDTSGDLPLSLFAYSPQTLALSWVKAPDSRTGGDIFQVSCMTRELMSIMVTLSGEAGLWPRARTKYLILVLCADLCGCFSLFDCIFLLKIYIFFQPFFPLVGLILSLVIIKCWKYHDAEVSCVSVLTSNQLYKKSHAFSKCKSQIDRF